MATITGVVKSLTGTVKAIAADGTERTLKVGDQVLQGEKILTADASYIVIEFSNGAVIDLGRNMEIALTEETLQEAAAAQAVGAGQAPEQAAEAQATVEEIQKALLEGKDITELEATAAGPAAGGGGGDSIHDMVIITYVGGEFVPTYGFDTIGPESEFPPPPEQDIPIEEPDEGDPIAVDNDPATNPDATVLLDENAQSQVTGNILDNDDSGPDDYGNPPIISFTYNGELGPIQPVEIIGSVLT
ncbi:MAG: retention module-containing protein, partial [Gammaproteobacteria bacterium]